MQHKTSKRTGDQRQWERLLRQISTRKDVLAGSLSSAYLPCNKGGCKCTRGQLHGPTWRLGYRQGGKSTTVYVRADEVPQVKAATGRYAQLRRALLQAGQRNLRAFLNRTKRQASRQHRGRG